ncbi:ABC transporter substrate-binding protein [Salibacterium salarium]|uniref:ABC transporter substrate-binding protein n=1 Tax=Salibacterium salarium TaxID=284579 RepID=UPI001FE558A4|nr:iron-siderophore ABC transporter substrate-binding protein [Salibacterium salarium]
MVLSRKSIFAILILMLFSAVLVACGSSGDSEETTQSTGNVEEDTENESQEATESDVRVIEHAMGETEIEGTPEKVVTLFQGATDTSLLLGVKPVGAVESWVEKPWYKYIRDEMEDVTNVGLETQPNVEEIIELQPDLIIASKSRHEKIYDKLSEIAPTVMTEDHYHWKPNLSISAKALNKEAEEEKFLAEWDQKVATFKEELGDELNNTEVAIVGFRSDHARIFFDTFPALVIEDLGLSRPANQTGDDWGVKLTSKETIPEMDADVIFDMTSLTKEDGRVDTRKEWTSHRLWGNLEAVQNDRVYKVDPVIWTNGSGPMAAMKW